MDIFSNNKINKIKNDLDFYISNIIDVLQLHIIFGTATDGLNGYLEDTSKSWDTDVLVDKKAKLTIDDIDYLITITSNTSNKIYFTPIEPPTNATATIGTGDEGAGQGQVIISAIGDLYGSSGNLCSVTIINGNTHTGEKHASYNVETHLLTITIDTNGLEEQVPCNAGDISSILTADGLDSLFSVDSMIAGSLPKGFEPIIFSGGDDGIVISEGDSYRIFYSDVLDNLSI